MVRKPLYLALTLAFAFVVGCAGRDVRPGAPRVTFESDQRAPRRVLDPIESERLAELDPGSIATPTATAGNPRRSLDDALLLALRSAVIQQGARSVGSTSMVLKVPLDGGLVAAFKPDTKKHRGRWRAEVAAYRLADALGLDGVPPSVPRAAKMSALLASIRSPSTRNRLVEQGIPDGPDALPGAMIAWLPSLRPLPLEHEPMWTAWGEWLSATPTRRPIEGRVGRASAKAIAAAHPLAGQIAAMVLFDHLTGNRDRWSGFNVMVDETGTRLVYLDNNLAFDAVIDAPRARRRQLVLARVERFPRKLVDAMRALDRAQLEALFGEDDLGLPLLSGEQLDACLARRDELIAHVDSIVARNGEAAAYAFE